MLGLTLFAQATDTVNTTPTQNFTSDPTTTQPLTTDQSGHAAGIIAGLGAFMLVVSLISLVNFIFFILSLIHLIKHPNVPNRIVWIIVILLIPFGAFVYYLWPRKAFDKSGGAQQTPQYNNGQAQPSQQVPVQSPSDQPAPFGAGTAPQPPVATPDFSSNPSTPVTSPTVNPQPQVAAAPANPVQLPPNPVLPPNNSFEPVKPQEFQPSAPQVIQPQQSPQNEAPLPGTEENITRPDSQNPNNQV